MPLVDVQLQGGPCDGNTETVAEDFNIWPPVYCGGHTYTHVAGSSNPVLYKDAGPTGGSIKAPHALSGWHAIQHSVNVNMRQILKESERTRLRALQSLARARKVRL